MISSRLFKAFQQRGLLAAAQSSQAMPFYNAPVRFFSKENETAEAAEEVDAAEQAPEPVPEPVKAKAAAPKKAMDAYSKVADMAPLDKSLFEPFSLGNIKQIDSTPDNRPPSEEDTIEGRYAGVLFTTASQNSELFTIYEDMMFLQQIYANSEMFRQFTENGGVGSKEIAQFNTALTEIAPFSPLTLRFLTVLAENKRFYSIDVIATKYGKLYQEFNKE